MSLENEVKSLREAVVTLTEVIRNIQGSTAPATTAAPQVTQQPAPVDTVPAPVPQVTQQPAPVAAPAPTMPTPPSFAAPTPAPTGGAPFTDHKGLIEYVMARYQALGADKGAMIQQVLVNMGYQNINDVKPEHYGNLYAGIEALK